MLFALCEDDANDRESLLRFIRRWSGDAGVPCETLAFEHTAGLFASDKARRADAVLLDIYLPANGGMKPLGVEAARKLRCEGFAGAVVFITSSDEFYPEGFEVAAAHYLIKPVTYEAFCAAMSRVPRGSPPPERYLTVPVGRDTADIPFSALLYAEVYNHQTLLHTATGTLATLTPLKEVEVMLDSNVFLRCFRSYVVNLGWIEQVGDAVILMKNGARVPLSRRDAPAVREHYLAYCFQSIRREEKP